MCGQYILSESLLCLVYFDLGQLTLTLHIFGAQVNVHPKNLVNGGERRQMPAVLAKQTTGSRQS